MTESYFQNFLSDRNDQFIDLYSSESAIWLMDTLRGGRNKTKKKKCVLISFEPPLASPPIVFNWNEEDIWYETDVRPSEEFYAKVEQLIDQSEFPYVVFLEKKKGNTGKKIEKFVQDMEKRGTGAKFFLAEYVSPLTSVEITLLKVG